MNAVEVMDLERKRMERHVYELEEEKREWERRYNEEVNSKEQQEEQYEYETIQILPGTIAWESDLNRLGEKGYRLVATVPLTTVNYAEAVPTTVTNGTNLIFQRRKETE